MHICIFVHIYKCCWRQYLHCNWVPSPHKKYVPVRFHSRATWEFLPLTTNCFLHTLNICFNETWQITFPCATTQIAKKAEKLKCHHEMLPFYQLEKWAIHCTVCLFDWSVLRRPEGYLTYRTVAGIMARGNHADQVCGWLLLSVRRSTCILFFKSN